MEDEIKYVCENCGSLHEWKEIKYIVARKAGFTPIKVEHPKPEPKPEPKARPVAVSPAIKEAEYVDDEDDLKIDGD